MSTFWLRDPQLRNDSTIQDEMIVSVWHLLHKAKNAVIMLMLGVDGQILKCLSRDPALGMRTWLVVENVRPRLSR